jgi:S-DNA-T family DNA segregation ATPase FtsK/SpoIIIE
VTPVPVFVPRRPTTGDPAAAGGFSPYGARPPEPKTTLDRGREAGALCLFAGAVYSALALASFRADPNQPDVHGADWVGPVGASLAHGVVFALGAVAWAIPIELAVFAAPLLRRRASIANLARLAGDVLVAGMTAALLHIAMSEATVFGAMPAGGAFGELLGEVMRSLFSALGSYIIGLTVIGLILIGRASFSFIGWVERAGRGTGHAAAHAKRGARAVASAWSKARDLDKDDGEQEEPRIDESGGEQAIIAALADEEEPEQALPPLQIAEGSDFPLAEPDLPKRREPEAEAAPAKGAKRPSKAEAAVRTPAAQPEDGPTIVDTRAEMKSRRAPGSAAANARPAPAAAKQVQLFRLPNTDQLEPPPAAVLEIDRELLRRNAKLLEKTLADYGVQGMVEEIHPGPTVTTYEVSPQAGTKVSKVASLADDLALGLSRKVRIIAPIPGKNRIGFEIPNESRVPVSLRDLVEDQRFTGLSAPLPVVLGRDHVGAPFFADLASMPHVIVAGATGAGKSVGLNVMLTSLLFRRTPEELRLLMIDPKVVELAPFDKIPHMLLPVVTDMKQASNALKWAVDEMERRYQLFANAGTKNIATYNAWVDRVRKGLAKAPAVKSVAALGADGEPVTVAAAADGSDQALPERIAYIVIVVDEFSDLMMQQGKDVEAAVARLAQKARAAGMHVILATQRPSVDVITGIIKANFPTRIAFRVAQKVDSRTILDEQGAEHLLGKGDMLVKMNGTNETRRVQCPFISEEEVQRLTDFLRGQGAPVYDENILKPRDDEPNAAEEDATEQDPLYDAAVRIVADTRRCSTSWLQRKLNLGYNRAARIVEVMEKRGLVGPANGAKEREVLISSL